MIKKKKKMSWFDFWITVIMLLILFITIYPLYFTVIASFSDPDALAAGKVVLWPVGFTTISYQQVFAYKDIWKGYANTIFYTVCGTLLALTTTIPTAYSYQKEYLPFKRGFTAFFLVSMYFGGGVVPMYLMIKSMGLLNTRTILIVLGCFSVYNMLVTRTYFSTSIPDTLYEAADIDGAGEFWKFFKIGLPLAKPITAVMTLYYAVGYWNSYMNALIYTSNRDYEPLQLVLRRVLVLNQNALNDVLLMTTYTQEQLIDSVSKARAAYSMKYALVFIACLPLLIMYPFVQKHFVKGVMLGSVKG